VVIAAKEMGSEQIKFRRLGKDRIQANGAGKDCPIIGDTPGDEFFPDIFWRIACEQARKALRFEAVVAEFGRTIDEVLALVDPAKHIFSEVVEHADFGVAASQETATEIIWIAAIARDHA
jgi:hypothetical protein